MGVKRMSREGEKGALSFLCAFILEIAIATSLLISLYSVKMLAAEELKIFYSICWPNP